MSNNHSVEDITPSTSIEKFRDVTRAGELYNNTQLYNSHTLYYGGVIGGAYSSVEEVEEIVPNNYSVTNL